MKYMNTEIPKWLEDNLNSRSPEINFNHIIELLLQDYIKRNKPKHIDLTDEQYVNRYAIKKQQDGTLMFYNHDIDKWEEPTQNRLDVLHQLELNFSKRYR